MNRKRARLGVLMMAAVLVAAPYGPAAAAPSGSFNDPSGDANPNDPRADIVSTSVSWTGTTLTFSVVTAAPEAPTNPNWTSGDTYAAWDIFTNANEWLIVSFNVPDDGGPVAEVREPDGNTVCGGAASFRDNAYVAEIDASCLKDPASFDMQAFMSYHSVSANTNSLDTAPEGEGRCCAVTRP
ncbi:MAG: hypothetical protein ACRDYV_18875 [Acidimicrobiia bacterium]